MAPSTIIPRETLASPTETRDVSSEGTKAWMIVAITLGIVFLVFLIVFISITVLRRKQYKQAKANDPYLSRQEFRRRSRMTDLDREWDDEQKRRMIIRKSLASRPSQSSMSSRTTRQGSISSRGTSLYPALSIITTNTPTATAFPVELAAALPRRTATMTTTNSTELGMYDDGGESPASQHKGGHHRGRRVSLRDDWKDYEASVRRERSRSREVHSAGGDLALPERTLSRSRSSSQGSLLNHSLPPLPTIVASPAEEEEGIDSRRPHQYYPHHHQHQHQHHYQLAWQRVPQPHVELEASPYGRIPGITVQPAP